MNKTLVNDLSDLTWVIPGWTRIEGNLPFTHGVLCPLHHHDGAGRAKLIAQWPYDNNNPIFFCQARCMSKGILSAVEDKFNIKFVRSMKEVTMNTPPPVLSFTDILNAKRWIGIENKKPKSWQGHDGTTYIRIHSHPANHTCNIYPGYPTDPYELVSKGGVEDHSYAYNGTYQRRPRTILAWENYHQIDAERIFAGEPAFCFTGDDCPPIVVLDIDPPKSRQITEEEHQIMDAINQWSQRKMALTEVSASGNGTHIIFAIAPDELKRWQQLAHQYQFNDDMRGLVVDVRRPGDKAHIHITRDWVGEMDENKPLPIVRIRDMEEFPIIQEHLKPSNEEPLEERTDRTYIKWAEDANLDIDFTAKSTEKQAADLARILRHSSHRIVIVRGTGVIGKAILSDILIQKDSGYWGWLSGHEGMGLVKMLLDAGGNENKQEAIATMYSHKLMPDAEAYGEWMHQRVTRWRSASHYRDLVAQMQTWIAAPPSEISIISTDMIDNINDFPVLPLKEGGAISLEDDTTYSTEELGAFYLTTEAWAIEHPNWTEYKRAQGGREMSVVNKYSAIINRVGYNLRISGKKADIFVATNPNWGKTAISSAMAKACPAIYHIAKPKYDQTTRFTPMHKPLTTHRVVLYDEAHKMGNITNLLFDATAPMVRVEDKGRDEQRLPRLATTMFIGNDFPDIDITTPGLVALDAENNPRLRWVNGVGYDNTHKLTEDEWQMLHEPYCQNLILCKLIEAAREKKSGLNDPAIKAWITKLIEEESDPAVIALKDRYEGGTSKDFTTNADLKSTIESADTDIPKSKAFTKLIKEVFPAATAKKTPSGRGYSYIKERE